MAVNRFRTWPMIYKALRCVFPLLLVLGLASPILVRSGHADMDTKAGSAGSDPGLQELHDLVVNSDGRPAEDDLLRLESKYPRKRASALSKFLRGYLHYSAGDYPGAVQVLGGKDDAKAIESYCSLGDYSLFYRAKSEETAASPGAALEDYRALFDKYPDSLMAHDARLGAARSSLALGDPKSALQTASRLAELSDPDALFITGQVLEAQGKKPDAARTYREIYFLEPASTASEKASQQLDALGASLADNPGSQQEDQSRADKLFEAKQYAEAAAAYQKLVTGFPDSARNDEVELRSGIALMNSRQAPEASAYLEKVSERSSDLHAEALYYRSEVARRAGQAAEAAVATDRLMSQHRQSKWAEMALYNLAVYLDKHGRSSDAGVRFRQIIVSYPKSEYAPEASYNLGLQAYQSGRYAEAARILEQHLATYHYPDSKFLGESGFWAARAEERTGNKPRALAIYDMVSSRYRYGYDGYAAARRATLLRAQNATLAAETTKPGSDLEKIQQDLSLVQPLTDSADGSEKPYIARADDLELIGLTDFAVRELGQALKSAPNSPRINLRFAQLYSRKGDPFQATLILRHAYPDLFSYADADLPREAWEIFFPLRYWDTIKQEARRYGIDPYIAAGLIRQESVFNQNALSHAGARGLMQVMSGTGELIAKREGEGKITAADLYNPTINIKLGMNYLAQLIGQFGKIEYAAAAYNAGPGRAKQWIAERGSLETDEWVESIPFTETRGYVQGVLRNAANYRRLYHE
jgi:soluble lytic murein transglycosylase